MEKDGDKEQLMDGEEIVHRPAHLYDAQGILIYAIGVTVACCWPCGVVAIWKAAKANELYAKGEEYEASVKARESRRWAHASVVVALLWILLISILYIHFLDVSLEMMKTQMQDNTTNLFNNLQT